MTKFRWQSPDREPTHHNIGSEAALYGAESVWRDRLNGWVDIKYQEPSSSCVNKKCLVANPVRLGSSDFEITMATWVGCGFSNSEGYCPGFLAAVGRDTHTHYWH